MRIYQIYNKIRIVNIIELIVISIIKELLIKLLLN